MQIQHVQVLVIQAAAQMEAVKRVEDATVIFIVTLWATAARIFQRHVPPGKLYLAIRLSL